MSRKPDPREFNARVRTQRARFFAGLAVLPLPWPVFNALARKYFRSLVDERRDDKRLARKRAYVRRVLEKHGISSEWAIDLAVRGLATARFGEKR